MFSFDLASNSCCSATELASDSQVSIEAIIGDHVVGNFAIGGDEDEGGSGFYLSTLVVPPVVDDDADLPDAYPADGVCSDADHLCSLRAALQLVQPGQTIAFDLLGTGGSTVELDSELPAVPANVTIDGTSEDGGIVTLQPGDGAVPADCLDLTGGDDVNGLSIGGCGTGIVAGGDEDSLEADNVGLAADGETATPNGVGVQVLGSGTVIGGPLPNGYSAPMVVSGNTSDGIEVLADATGTTIQETDVGVGSDGETPVANGEDGISVVGSEAEVGPDDTVSANDGWGIDIAGGVSNEVAGDTVGPDSQDVGNALGGVEIDASSDNQIGDGGEGLLNVISGNGGPGVEVLGSAASDNVIAENYVGLGASGEAALGNGGDGILVDDAPGTEVGTSDGFNNVAANDANGIEVSGAGATSTVLVNNFVGIGQDGFSVFPNAMSGILVDGAPDTQVGGASLFNTIGGNDGDGVMVTGAATGSVISGNFVGVDYTGETAISNQGDGVEIDGTSGVQVGSADAFNLISGNLGDGVDADDAPETTIAGDFIGTDDTGETTLGNVGPGVSLDAGSDGSVVGEAADDESVPGDCSGSCDLISGNLGSGVTIDGASGVTVGGDFIGVDPSASVVLGNGVDGITVSSAASTIEGNVISGNVNNGVTVNGASGTTITGNAIGSDPTGTDRLANGGAGIVLDGATATTIGGQPGATSGPCVAPCNVISGNIGDGVDITGGSTATTLSGDDIGTDASGTVADPNDAGVTISASPGNTVSADLVAGNDSNGVQVSGAASTTDVIEADVIGLASDGSSMLANSGDGIDVSGSPGVTIGGPVAAEGNVVSGNGANGIELDGPTTTGAVIEHNLVGTNAAGNAADGNSDIGIELAGAANDTVGGAGNGNVVSGNRVGIAVTLPSATGDTVTGNFVGTDQSGQVPIGNSTVGINLAGPSTLVGGTSGVAPGQPCTGACNVISGNGTAGVTIEGSGDTVAGNAIGAAADGTTALPNDGDGVLVASATKATIGGTEPDEGNLIVDNTGTGVAVTGSSATRNAILSNSIYDNGNLGIELGTSGVAYNDPTSFGSGPNDSAPFPVLDAADSGSQSATLSGVLDSFASTSFQVQLFVSPSCDASGFGEGEHLLGAVAATSDASGHATFSDTVPDSALPVGGGGVITATATVASGADEGDSSQFSRCVTLGGEAAATNPPYVMAGEPLTVFGDGLVGTVAAVLHSDPVDLGTFSANGTFSASLTIPSHTPPGHHVLELDGDAAAGAGAPVSVYTDIDVEPSGGPPAVPQAPTTILLPLVAMAIGALVLRRRIVRRAR
ncbi:MAG TPA: NosD domain-containing protein [Acidimicrobiales bacterium]|nr:NosD domain-containing protein [Acidimicrobiales bacterium]